MKLKTLSEDGENDLILDPNWLMRVSSMPFKVPVNYLDAKRRFKQEIDQLNFNDDKELYYYIDKCLLWAEIDITEYPQYFRTGSDDFHVDDDFSNIRTHRRSIWVNAEGLQVRHNTNTGEGDMLPPNVVQQLVTIYNENRLILLQAFDSYLRDKGKSIRDYGVRNIGVYGM